MLAAVPDYKNKKLRSSHQLAAINGLIYPACDTKKSNQVVAWLDRDVVLY
jgi:hypothetical protein